MDVQPLRDFILVTRDEAPEKTPGGLFIPTTAEANVVVGTVMAVGSGRVTLDGTVVSLEVKKGDKVAYSVNVGTESKVDGQSVRLLREDQVLYIVR